MNIKKRFVLFSLGIIVLSALLLLPLWPDIFTVGAQEFLAEDEIVALQAWGDTKDPNVEAILAAQDAGAAEISLSEPHLGYDKETGEVLDDPTITRHTSEVGAQSAPELKEGSDIDPGRIRFGSGYEFIIEPGIAPEVYQQLSNAAISEASGDPDSPYVVIQFNFPVDLETKSQLEQTGVTFGEPIDKLSFYAKIPTQALPAVSQAVDQGKINFIGTTPSESRVASTLKRQMLARPNETLPVTVQLFETPTAAQIQILETLMTIEGVSEGPVHLVSGHIEAARVFNLAQQPFVQWVEDQVLNEPGNLKQGSDLSTRPVPANFEGDLAAGSDIIKRLGFDGNGINVAIMDSGIARQGSTYHPDLPASRIVDQYYWSPTSDFESADATADDGHGTHVAGSIGGSGVYETDLAWQGIAPDVDFFIYRLCCNVPNGWGYIDSDFQASLQRAANNDVYVSNNSWGGGNGQYRTNAQLSDRAVRGEYSNQYINMVIITHNDEALSRSPGTAKNALTVGAVKDGNWPPVDVTTCPSGGDDNWPPAERVCFSNFGPIDADGDGNSRVKPDIMAPGVRIRSAVPWYLYGDNRYYDTWNGTSMAAPQVSGAVAQFLDAYSRLISWPEVVKAAFIVSATDVGGTDVDHYGRGMLNAFHAIYDQAYISDISFWNSLLSSTGATNDHTFTVPTGFEEVRVALTWADPVSAGGSDDVVNDLDVRVYDGGGAQVGFSITSDDTVEYVKVTSGTPGTWHIQTKAASISSVQYYGLAALVVLKDPDLSISGCTDPANGTYAGGYFYLYTAIANSGFAAPGSYVRLQLPNTTDYEVLGARIYTRDGRSHYYTDPDLYNTDSGLYWRVAVGETINGYSRVIRWFLKCTAPNCLASSFQTIAYYRDGGGTTLGDQANVTFSECTSAELPVELYYLPLILK